MVTKKWFPGWGMMRFWESGKFEGSASHAFAIGHEGDGDEAAFPGAVKSESWDRPYRDTLRSLSMIPRRAGLH